MEVRYCSVFFYYQIIVTEALGRKQDPLGTFHEDNSNILHGSCYDTSKDEHGSDRGFVEQIRFPAQQRIFRLTCVK